MSDISQRWSGNDFIIATNFGQKLIKDFSINSKLALFLCNPATGFPEFLMSTYESACPIPGYNPEARKLLAITTIGEFEERRISAKPRLKIGEIKFVSARNVSCLRLEPLTRFLERSYKWTILPERQMLRNDIQESRRNKTVQRKWNLPDSLCPAKLDNVQ